MLDGLYQQGSLKALLPRVPRDAWPTVVTLNLGGGVAGGDVLDMAVRAPRGTAVTVTAQAAERFYRALDEPARVMTRLAVEGALEWLPQESILFDGCALDRRLEVDLAENAWFLGAETLVFGRAAMGETLRRVHVSDRIVLRRGGRLILNDALRLRGDAAPGLRAMGDDARAATTLVLADAAAERRLDDLRAALGAGPAAWGASAWDGMLVARLVASDAASVRVSLGAALAVLRVGRPLPR